MSISEDGCATLAPISKGSSDAVIDPFDIERTSTHALVQFGNTSASRTYAQKWEGGMQQAARASQEQAECEAARCAKVL
jgi:hypothetical protein